MNCGCRARKRKCLRTYLPSRYVDDTGGGTAVGTDYTIDVSSIIMSTDYLMIASISYDAGPSETITKPLGWTEIYNEYEAGQGHLALYWKFWELGETDYTWSMSLLGDVEGGASIYTCVDATNPINVVGPKNNGNSDSPKAKGVIPSKKNTTSIMYVGAASSALFDPPDGWIKRWQDVNTSTSDTQNPSGPINDATGLLSSTAVWQTVMVAINPCSILFNNPVYFDYSLNALPTNVQSVENITYEQGIIRFGYTPTIGNGS